ncbi:uncharacterized protein LOC144432853 isoform X2 [Glandiceps talaboti]
MTEVTRGNVVKIAQDLNVTMDIVFRFGLYVMVMKTAAMEVTRGNFVKIVQMNYYSNVKMGNVQVLSPDVIHIKTVMTEVMK